MRSATVFASVLALATSALAQEATAGYAVVSAPGNGEIVPSGKTYTIQWSAGKFTGPATISLMGGNDPTTLMVLDPIAVKVDVENESYSWSVDCSLGEEKTYGIKIADVATQGETFQYSFPFEIKGPSCGSDDSTTSSSSSASASATHSASGYPTKKPTVTATPTPSGYPVETISSSSSSHSFSTSLHHSNSTTSASSHTSTSVKSTTSVPTTVTTLSTFTTPIVTVTETSVGSGSSSSGIPASSTTASTPIPTAGAAKAGAGFALGLFAAVLAL